MRAKHVWLASLILDTRRPSAHWWTWADPDIPSHMELSAFFKVLDIVAETAGDDWTRTFDEFKRDQQGEDIFTYIKRRAAQGGLLWQNLACVIEEHR